MTVQELLGIVIDILNFELRISQERQIKILQNLNAMYVVKKLLSLISKLSFITNLLSTGRTFLRYLINLAKSDNYLHFKVKMNVQDRRDITWWTYNVTTHNGTCMFL